MRALGEGKPQYLAYQEAFGKDVTYGAAATAASHKVQTPLIQDAIAAELERQGLGIPDAVAVLARNSRAERTELHQKTGDVIPMGPDGKVQLAAVELAAKLAGWMAPKQSQVSTIGVQLVIDGGRLLSRTIDPPHSPRDITPENT